MKQPTFHGRVLLPLSVFAEARAGDPLALERVLRYYDRYINKICTRTLYDKDGLPHICIHYENISIIILLALFLNFYVSKIQGRNATDNISTTPITQLFNLFYLNTSKAHEIAMLIDNKIMKTIEREQISEELLKYGAYFRAASRAQSPQ